MNANIATEGWKVASKGLGSHPKDFQKGLDAGLEEGVGTVRVQVPSAPATSVRTYITPPETPRGKSLSKPLSDQLVTYQEHDSIISDCNRRIVRAESLATQSDVDQMGIDDDSDTSSITLRGEEIKDVNMEDAPIWLSNPYTQ